MLRTLVARRDAFPLRTPFRISRGVKTVADVVTVEISADGATGRGEGVPYQRYGESVEGALAAIEEARGAIEGAATREELEGAMAAGGTRNAVDSALWDLQAKLPGRSVTERLCRPAMAPRPTAHTVRI